MLTSILDRLEKTISSLDTSAIIQQKATIMCKTFDNEFTMLSNVAIVQAQTKHDASLLNSICTNIRNDIETLNSCIKVLRQSMDEGK